MTAVISARARRALDELLALPKIQGYASREGARGKCFEASFTAALWFRMHGVPVRIVRFVNPKVVTPFSRDELRAADDWAKLHHITLASGIEGKWSSSELYHLNRIEQHAIELEGSLLVDLTWRGWEPESAFPRMTTLEEYGRDFDVDDKICGHCGARANERCTHAPPFIERMFLMSLGLNRDGGAQDVFLGVPAAQTLAVLPFERAASSDSSRFSPIEVS